MSSTNTCPNCGAALEGSSKCAYCGTEVAHAPSLENQEDIKTAASIPVETEAPANDNTWNYESMAAQLPQPDLKTLFLRQMRTGFFIWLAWWLIEGILYATNQARFDIVDGKINNILFSQPIKSVYWWIRGGTLLIVYPTIMIAFFRQKLQDIRVKKMQKAWAKASAGMARNSFK